MLGQFLEKILKVFVYLQIVCLGGLNEAIEDSAGLSAVWRIDVDPVLSSDRERTDGLLSGIVVHRDATVGQEPAKKFFLVDTVPKPFAGGSFLGQHGVYFFCPRKEVVDQGLKKLLPIPFSFCIAQVVPLIVLMEQLGDPFRGLCGYDTIGTIDINRLDQLSELSLCVDPASGDLQTVPLFLQGMVDLIAVRDEGAGISAQKLIRTIRPAGWLVVIEHYGMADITCAAPVYPHETLGTCFPAIFDDLEGSLVGMDDRSLQKLTVEFIIDQGKVLVRGFHHPVRQSVGAEIDTIVRIATGLSVQRKMVEVFPGDGGSEE